MDQLQSFTSSEREKRQAAIQSAARLAWLETIITNRYKGLTSIAVALVILFLCVAGIVWCVDFAGDWYSTLVRESPEIGAGVWFYLVAVLGLFPVIILMSGVYMSISIITILIRTIFASAPQQNNAAESTDIERYLATESHRLSSTESTESTDFANLLLDRYPESSTVNGPTVLPIYTTIVSGQSARWARVLVDGRLYLALSVATDNALPHTMIDSCVEGVNILPRRNNNAQKISLAGDIDRYFAVYSTPANYRVVSDMLTPDVLWLLLMKLDMCDVELRGSHIIFLWPDTGKTDEILLHIRAARVSPFVQKLLRTQSTNNASIDTMRPRRLPKYATYLNLVIASSLAISGITSFLLLPILSGYSDDWFSPTGWALMMFILLLPVMCVVVMLTFVVMVARGGRQVVTTLRMVARVRRYLYYYGGRT